MKPRLAIITTHPIQYNAPLFRWLVKRGNVEVMVFYTWGKESLAKYDPGFQKKIAWDIPLLDGYAYTFVENISTNKGSHHYRGIVNPSLVGLLKNWNPDAILIYGWNFKSHLQVMRHFHKKIPVLFRGDSTLLNEPQTLSIKKIARRLFLRWVYRHIDFALYTGYSNYDYFLAHGVKKNQLIHAPHAIDLERFTGLESEYSSKAKEKLRDLGINPASKIFLYAGKLEAIKCISLLVLAYSEQVLLNTHLVIVGNGNQEASLKNEFKNFQHIHFLDFQNQSMMPVIYRMADIFVLPSRSETWGLAANEAMACGCAVLMSSACGACRDLIVEGKNGYSFQSGNKEDLKNKLKVLAENDHLDEMKAFARMHIQNFSFEKICEAIEGCIGKK